MARNRLIAIALVLLCIAAMWIPMPDVDWQLLHASFERGSAEPALRRALDWIAFHTNFGVTSVAFLPLVVVRGALAMIRPPRVVAAGTPMDDRGPFRTSAQPAASDEAAPSRLEPLAFVVYLAACALVAASRIEWLRGYRDDDGVSFTGSTLGSLSSIAQYATMVAGSAIVWMASRWISRSGVGRGPLWLFGSVTALQWLSRLADVGISVGLGDVWPRSGITPLRSAWVVAAALAVLWVRPPRAWPVSRWRDLRYESPADIVFAVITMSALALGAFDVRRLLVFGGWHDRAWWSWIGLVALAPIIGSRGVPAIEDLVTAVGALLVPVFAWFVGVRAVDGSLPPFVKHGLIRGGYAYRVTLRGTGADAASDENAITRRLRAIGVRTEIERVGSRDIALVATSLHPLERTTIERALVQHHAALHWLAHDQSPLDPPPDEPFPGVWIRTESVPAEPDGRRAMSRYTASSPEALAPAIASVNVPANTFVAIECMVGVDAQFECTPWLLEREAIIEARDVAHVAVRRRAPDRQRFVLLDLDARGTTRFAEQTALRTHEMLAVVIDGRIVSRPVVNAPIRDGTVPITPPGALAGAALEEDLGERAAAFGAALHATWTVERDEPAD